MALDERTSETSRVAFHRTHVFEPQLPGWTICHSGSPNQRRGHFIWRTVCVNESRAQFEFFEDFNPKRDEPRRARVLDDRQPVEREFFLEDSQDRPASLGTKRARELADIEGARIVPGIPATSEDLVVRGNQRNEFEEPLWILWSRRSEARTGVCTEQRERASCCGRAAAMHTRNEYERAEWFRLRIAHSLPP